MPLAEDILENGQQSPIYVRQGKGRWVLQEGLHRLEAVKLLGSEFILGHVVAAKKYHPNYTLFGENDIYLQSGKNLERASYEDYLGRYKNIRTFMHQPQFHVRGDTAWVTYYWSDSGFARESGERFTTQGKSTRVFVKENGKWLCIHGHFTSVGD